MNDVDFIERKIRRLIMEIEYSTNVKREKQKFNILAKELARRFRITEKEAKKLIRAYY